MSKVLSQSAGAISEIDSDTFFPPGYIDGLQMQWVSSTALTVTSGAAYIQGSSKVLRATSPVAKTGLVLSASTWYHLYLYSNAGTADVEIVTTAPDTPYNGTARCKTGDTSRRYLGSVLTDAGGSIYQFVQSHGRVAYTSGNAAGIFSILSAGAATTSTAISLTALVPIAATFVTLRVANNSSTSNFSIQFAAGADKFLSIATVPSGTFGPPVTVDCPISNQAMAYICGSSGGNANIGLLGYVYER